MFSLDHTLASSTCVAERPVGQIEFPNSILPCPMGSQNSFHPFLHPPPPLSPPAHIAAAPSLNPSLLPPSHTSLTSSPSSCVICSHKPQTGRSIIHNELRPHVPAADHIFSWRTPFGSHHHTAVAQKLPAPLFESTLMAVQGALAPNTKSTYGAGPLRFTQFCDK